MANANNEFPCVCGQYLLPRHAAPSDLDYVEACARSIAYEGAASVPPGSPTTLLHATLPQSADMDPLCYFVRDELC